MSIKKESDKTTTRVSDDTTRVETTTTTGSYSPTLLEQRHSVDRALDESRDNIRRTIEEARKEIPRRTQAFNDYQEHSLETAREITDRALRYRALETARISKGGYKVISVDLGSIWMVFSPCRGLRKAPR
ncbi:MAG: hypothetical protein WBF33_09455 [Candidatus Nitrosopolaris sp.]|jgi:hypothetical protein